MDPQEAIFGRTVVRRGLALLACAALLYFAAGRFALPPTYEWV